MNDDPAIPEKSTNQMKYETGNKVVRGLLDNFLQTLAEEVARISPRRIVDLGCGEGIVAGYLKEKNLIRDYHGFDISEQAVKEAARIHPDLQFEVGDFTRMPPGTPGDLVICLEVLEHLSDTQAALRSLRRWTTSHVIISVPWEPWFRLGNLARGKYLATLGNHPEHIQAFRPVTLRQAIGEVFDEPVVRTSFPWLFALAKTREPDAEPPA
jgi:SAM-dependent methyltransferase